jgi:serralysin
VDAFSNETGDYIVTAAAANASGMVFTADEIAWQLIDNGRAFFGTTAAAFNVGADNSLSVNITALDGVGQTLALAALRSWTNVTGIAFTETSGVAEITFDDNQNGAFANPTVSSGVITSSIVNIGQDWISSFGTTLNSYTFETYIHEIGHALGLGHGGNYNSSATFGTSNFYLNDSHHMTLMSYMGANNDEFGAGSINTFVNARFRYILTPQLADIIAIQFLYGDRGNAFVGDTTYGYNANSGDATIDGFVTLADASGRTAMTIWDEGGRDTLDFRGHAGPQILDLNDESFSSVMGGTFNLAIARGVVVENAIGGDGADSIYGNAVDNLLFGQGGQDRIFGGGGNDYLLGGDGSDTIYGESGNDTFEDTLGANTLEGGEGNDYFYVGSTSSGSLNRIVGQNGFDSVQFNEAIFLDWSTNTFGGNILNAGLLRNDVEGWVLSGLADRLHLHTTSAASLVYGNGGNDTLDGGAGADTLYGGDGNDSLNGQGGSDTLIGDAGDDTFVDGFGVNIMGGGEGNDYFFVGTTASGSVNRIIGQGGFDAVQFSQTIFWDWSTNTFGGNALNANIAPNDVEGWVLSAGADRLHLFTTTFDTLVYGNGGNDTLDGGSGADTLFGGATTTR